MEKLMKVDEVAEMLNLQRATIYQLVHHKRIPATKINKKCLRFDPKAIRAWLESKSRPAAEEQPKTPVRRSPGRPRKNGNDSNYINSLVEQAKREVGV